MNLSFLLHTAQALWPFLAIITILVFFHELGHYSIARFQGVHVEIFSIGFGPEIFGWNDSKGTRWKISLIPLGGYVRFYDDIHLLENSEEHETEEEKQDVSVGERDAGAGKNSRGSFYHASLKARTAIVAAGPIANYILAILASTFLFFFSGEKILAPLITGIEPSSLAETIGLRPGDRITALDATSVERGETIGPLLTKAFKKDAKPVAIVVEREGKVLTYTFSKGMLPSSHRLGIELGSFSQKAYSLPKSFIRSLRLCYDLSAQTFFALGDMLIGKRDAKELGGILRIAHVSRQVANRGFYEVIWLCTLLSINLGFMNLLPIPGLDGGHLALYSIEKVKGSPLSFRVQQSLLNVGFLLIMGMMLFSLWNDIRQLKVFEILSSWIMG